MLIDAPCWISRGKKTSNSHQAHVRSVELDMVGDHHLQPRAAKRPWPNPGSQCEDTCEVAACSRIWRAQNTALLKAKHGEQTHLGGQGGHGTARTTVHAAQPRGAAAQIPRFGSGRGRLLEHCAKTVRSQTEPLREQQSKKHYVSPPSWPRPAGVQAGPLEVDVVRCARSRNTKNPRQVGD